MVLTRLSPNFDGRQILMEDGLWWKMTYDRRQTLIEDDIWWKRTYDGRQPSMEDNLQWKMTFHERRPFIEYNLLWKHLCIKSYIFACQTKFSSQIFFWIKILFWPQDPLNEERLFNAYTTRLHKKTVKKNQKNRERN